MNSSSPRIFWPTVTVILKRLMVGSILDWVGNVLGSIIDWVGLDLLYYWVAGNLWQSGSGQYGRRHQTLVQSSRAAQKILHLLSSCSSTHFGQLLHLGCRVQTVILSSEQIHCTQCSALWQDNDQSANRSKESFCESSVLQNFISTKQKVTSQWELKNSLKTVKECLWFSLQRDRTLWVVRTWAKRQNTVLEHCSKLCSGHLSWGSLVVFQVLKCLVSKTIISPSPHHPLRLPCIFKCFTAALCTESHIRDISQLCLCSADNSEASRTKLS